MVHNDSLYIVDTFEKNIVETDRSAVYINFWPTNSEETRSNASVKNPWQKIQWNYNCIIHNFKYYIVSNCPGK